MVSLQGEGEPTTHPQFWDMAELVRARGLTPFTITNGAQIDVERIAATFPRIGVSIDTLDAAEAERIGRHKLDRVLANLEALNARMGGKRIHIMTVNYGQPLAAVCKFARARGFSHSVQALQAKPDYAHRYPQLLDAPAPRYTHRCRYLERPLKRYYDIEGREYPCCFIKDARLHEPIEAMQAKMAAGEIPAACTGCREVLTPDSLPKPRAAAAASATVGAAAADSPAPVFSIVTTCKGRLEHLKQSLPRMAAQAGAEVIVVDYDCPDGAGAWVAENFPAVRVVRVADAPLFNARAGAQPRRRRGARPLARASSTPICCSTQISPRRRCRCCRTALFYSMANPQPSAFGTVVCRRDDFAGDRRLRRESSKAMAPRTATSICASWRTVAAAKAAGRVGAADRARARRQRALLRDQGPRTQSAHQRHLRADQARSGAPIWRRISDAGGAAPDLRGSAARLSAGGAIGAAGNARRSHAAARRLTCVSMGGRWRGCGPIW